MSVRKVNETFFLKVDSSRDVYNAQDTFAAHVLNDSDNSQVEITQPFEEVMMMHSGHSATADGGNIVNDRFITVKDSNLVQGDVVKVYSDYYYVKEVTATTVELFVTLRNDIIDGTLLEQVGNTGIYKVPIAIPQIGFYTIVVKNPNFQMLNRETTVKIIAEDITDAHIKLDAIIPKVDSIAAEKKYVSFV